MDASTQELGAHMGDSQILVSSTRLDLKLHINCLELKAVISFPLLNKVIQKLRATVRDNLNCPLVADTAVVPTPTLAVCGPPSHHSIQQRPSFTTGDRLGRQVVPSARLGALMQHYEAAGFSEAVSRLTAAPRRPLTNGMY